MNNKDNKNNNNKKDNKDNKSKVTISEGGFSNFTDPIFGYSPTDVYYNTEKKLQDSNVAIPTLDAVIKAKEWVDDINKK